MFVPGDVTQLIMVTYFRPNDLKQCLDSILANTVEPFKLAIIDNSTGGLGSILDSIRDERIAIYKNPTNLGKGRAFMKWYHQIMRGNQSDFFVSIDPDLVVPEGWLTRMLRAAYGLPNPGVLAPVLTQERGDTFIQQRTRGRLVMHKEDQGSGFVGPSLFRNRYTAGPLFLIHRPFFEQVGGYVQTQLYGNDDGELCKAAAKRNRFTGIVTDVEVLHLEGDVTPGYKAWKKRNVNRDVDRKGFWDSTQTQNSNDSPPPLPPPALA